jgi:hypothetical protein
MKFIITFVKSKDDPLKKTRGKRPTVIHTNENSNQEKNDVY